MRSSVSRLVTPRSSFLLLLFFASQFAIATPNSLTFQAKIVKPNSENLEEPSVYFKFRYTDALGTCVIYEEEFASIVMTGSKGLVSVELGAGVKTFPPAPVTLYDVFNFGTALSCLGAIPTATVTPTAVERRKVIVSFNDGSGLQTLPIMNLNSVPFSLHATSANNANQLGGVAAALYVKFTDITAAGCVAGQALRYTGASFVCENITGAGVATVTATAPVVSSGGANPNISIPKATSAVNGYLSSGDWSVFNSKLSNFSTLTSSDITTAVGSSLSGDVTGTLTATVVATVGGVSAASVATGVNLANNSTSANTASTIVRRDASGDFSASQINATTFSGTNTSSTNVSTRNIYLYDGTNTDRILFKAPSSGITNYTLTLPPAVGTNGQVLGTNSSGDLSWVNASSGSVTTVTATAPLVSSGGASPDISIAKASATVDGYLASGDFSIFSSKQPAGNYVTALSGDVTSAGFASGVVTTTLASIVTAGTSSKVTFDAKGRITASAALNSADITSALTYTPLQDSSPLSGDVTGSINANVVSNVGGVSAANVASGANLANAATSNNTASAIVRRNASGDFSAGTVNATTFNGTNSFAVNSSITNLYMQTGGANQVLIKANAGADNYTLTLPLSLGSNGQVLSTNASGDLSWVNASTGSVTSVTANAPLSSSGGATPAISLTRSSASVDGYLSSGDFSIFNSKLSAASVFSGDISGTSATISVDKIKGQNVTLGAATAGNYLRNNGTDWVNANLVSTDITNSLSYIPVNPTVLSNYLALAGGTMSGDLNMGAFKILNVKNVANSSNDPTVADDGKSLKWNNTSGQWEWFTAGVAGSGIATINGLSGSAQSLVIGSAGNDFSISSDTTTHTFNLPTASATKRGALSSADWTTFNNKLSNFSTLTSTDITSVLGVLPIANGGTNASSFANTYGVGYYDGTRLVTSPAGSSNQILVQTASGPVWTTATYPSATTANQLLYSSAANTVAGLATANNAFLKTDGSGVPSFSVLNSTDITTALGRASASVDGYLASSDFSIFNSKLSNFSTMVSADVTSALGYTPANDNAAWTLNVSGDVSRATGNVGIGTASPERKLHVATSSTGTPTTIAIENIDTTNGNGAGISFRGTTTGAGAGTFKEFSAIQSGYSIHDNATRSSSLKFYTSSAGVMLMPLSINASADITANGLSALNSGYVGIGTASPGFPLQVSGDISISGNYKINGVNIGSGTVGSVTAAATAGNPITVSSSTTSPSIDITRASATVNGYLASNDFSIFNSKLSNFSTMTSTDVTTALGVLPIANGGTNASSFANTYGVGFYDGTRLVTSPAGSSNQILVQTASGPVWTTATYPSATTANQLLYSSAANTVAGLATANNAFLKTDGSGVPSFSVLNSTDITTALGRASASVDGYLASSDFTTFNNKLSSSTVFSGDVSGTATTTSVDKIKGTTVTVSSLTTGEFLKFNGTAWINSVVDALLGTTGAAGGNATMTGGTSTTAGNAGGQANVVGGTPGVTGVGGAVNITGGPGGATSGAGGTVTIAGGAPTSGVGGSVVINAANGVGTSQAGGSISLTAGSGSATAGAGGAINLTSGAGTSLAAAGNITIQAGSNAANGGNGTVLVQGGNGGSAVAGPVVISGGTAGAAGTSTGGLVTIQGGAANSTNGSAGGGISILAANGYNGGTGGAITMTTGAGGAASATIGRVAGALTISAGAGGTSNAGWGGPAGAAVTISAGAGGAGGAGSTGGAGGDLNLNAGAAGATGNVNGGSIVLNGGAKTGTGISGNIILANTRGFVGIGTSSPASPLDVSGDFSLRGTAEPALAPSNQARIYADSSGVLKVSQNGGAYVNLIGAGAVTTVTATAPLVSSGGASPDISLARSSASADGYLASSDFSVFSSKLSNFSTLTSVDVSTALGAASGDLTGTYPSPTLVTTGVVASSDYTKVTVDAKGRVTSAGRLTSGDLTTLIGYTPANANAAWSANGSGDVSRTTANVGIGTAAPAGILDVRGGTAAASTGGTDINFYAQNGGVGGANGGNINLVPGAGSGGWPAGTVNVGPGDQNPSLSILHNYNDGYTSTSVASSEPYSALRLSNSWNTDGNSALQSFWVRNTATNLQTAYFGAVSVNTASSDVSPAFVWGRKTGASSYDETMRIDPTGKVGIGTASPATKLHVAGTIKISSGSETCSAVGDAGMVQYVGGALQFCNGSSWQSIGSGTGTTNKIPKFTAAGTIGDSAITDNGTTIVATRSIATTTNPVGAAAVNLALSNTHTLATPGGSTITLSNFSDGGVYNIIIADTVNVRTYTFAGCNASYFKPANAAITSGTRTVYGILSVYNGATYDCYITWSSGFQ